MPVLVTKLAPRPTAVFTIPRTRAAKATQGPLQGDHKGRPYYATASHARAYMVAKPRRRATLGSPLQFMCWRYAFDL